MGGGAVGEGGGSSLGIICVELGVGGAGSASSLSSHVSNV